MKKIGSITTSFEYSVSFVHDAFALDEPTLIDALPPATDHPTLAFVDSGLLEAWPELPDRLAAYLQHFGRPLADGPVIVPGGERCKDGWSETEKVIDSIRHHRLCRHSAVIAIGGGAVLDVVGLAASLVHRGVRLLRMPSTTVSQGDSGVGVKTGINLGGVKNLIGTFEAPHAVVNDLDLLRTLSPDLLLDGVAEAIKVAVIKDAEFLEQIRRSATTLSDGSSHELHRTIERSAELHLDHICEGGDPFELGTARPLDFGHWVAHWLEGASRYAVRHGSGVAIGIAVDALLAEGAGTIDSKEREYILTTLESVGLPITHPLLTETSPEAPERLRALDGLEEFREHLGGQLTLTWPRGLGHRVEVHEVDEQHLREAVELLARRGARPA